MDYKVGYSRLFNAMTKAVNILVDYIITNADGSDIVIPKELHDVIAVLREAQQGTEEMYILSGSEIDRE